MIDLNAVTTAVDAAFAEPIRIVPLVRNRGGRDPERPEVTINAVLRVRSTRSNRAAPSTGWQTGVEGQQSELHIARSAYPDLVVQQRDKLQATSRPGQPWFEVSRIDDRGAARLVLHLAEV